MSKRDSGRQVFVTYHTFGVIDGDDWPHDEPGPGNGLIYPVGNGAAIYTGIHTGPVTVQALAFDRPPERLDDTRDWQEIAEVSVSAPTGHLQVRSFEEEAGLPVLSRHGAGTYRVRVYAEGRDTDIDGTADSPFEHYRLEVWPAPPAAEIIHRRTDRYGEQLRHSRATASAARTAPASREPDGETLDEWVELDD